MTKGVLQHRQHPRVPCSTEGGQHPVLPLGSQGPMPGPLPTSVPCCPRLLPAGCGAAQPSPAVSELGFRTGTAVVPNDKGFTCPSLNLTNPCLQGKEVQTKSKGNGPQAIRNDGPWRAALSTGQRGLNMPSAGESTSTGIQLSSVPMNISKSPIFAFCSHMMATKNLLPLVLNDEFLIKVRPVPHAGCVLHGSKLPHNCRSQTSTARKGRDSAKARRISPPLREARLFSDAISYPTDPFNISFNGDVVG